MRRSIEPRAGKATAHRAAQAHDLSLHPLDRVREREAVRRGRPESHRPPSHGDSAAGGENDRDGSRDRALTFRAHVEPPGEAPGELLRAPVDGPAGLQRLPELSGLLATLAARRALFEVREEVCRVYELQLVVMVSLDQEARRPTVHHHHARTV